MRWWWARREKRQRGRIGREVAKKANGLGMNVIYHSRRPVSKSTEKMLKTKYVSENTLYEKSDIISLHVPYNKDTHHLMNLRIFKKMKKTSFLINTSRGKIVNEKQLVSALKKKQIQGAGMDVYESEPKMLSIRATNGHTDKVNYRSSFAVCK